MIQNNISLLSKHHLSKAKLAVFSIATALVGVIVLVSVFAAITPIAFEAESGALAGSAVNMVVNGASNGSAVKFTAPVGTSFVHPGILDSPASLNFVKAKIAINAEPWNSLYKTMLASSLAAPNYTPSPVTSLDCSSNNPGCVNLDMDGRAAYTNALIWYYTGNRANAQKSIQIMNAWSSTLTSETTYTQNYLYTAWAAEMYPRAAEIMRYTYTPSGTESAFDISSFNHMLTAVWQPLLAADTVEMKSSNGNWDLSMTDGLMNIGVFTDNHTTFDSAISRWQARTPSYQYLSSDNNSNGLPIAPPGGLYTGKAVQCFWLNSSSATTTCDTTNFHLASGQNQETCRDFVHVGLGVASMFNAAETAHIQGVDLYTQQQARLVAGLEYNTGILNSGSYPSDICQGAMQPLKAVATEPTYSIGYNHYASRLHIPMPNTLQTVQRAQASNTFAATDHQMVWEALTHTGTP